MQRISSKSTFFNKRIFPVIWFGFLAFFAVIAVSAMIAKKQFDFIFLLGPALMAVFGYFLMKALVFDLVDEVWDDGDVLIVRNGRREEQIPLTNIMNVSYTTFTNPSRVTLMLREPNVFGKEVTFSPPTQWNPFARPPIVADLIERIDAVRLRG